MREIKFRAWDKYRNRLINDVLTVKFHRITNDPCLVVYTDKKIKNNSEIKESDKEYCNEFNLMQYTGLNDKNGTKIFEGDILYTKHGVKCEGKGYYETYNEVVFKNGAFGVIGETTGDFLSFDYLPLDNEVVCGNIYENEELLKLKI